ncbi:MAG TPA: endonuclease III [bacterium]|nr:endonuclease III [bacterium]
MTTETLDRILTVLQRESRNWQVPIVTLVAERSNDPFQILVSTLLSLRTKDETTTAASRRLFAKATTPEAMLSLSTEEIRVLIFPVGFYKRKAENLHAVSRMLLDRYGGRVPADLDELLKIPGVGRKTANLVVTLGFGKPGICVDTHVHRITNRFGYVRTRTPGETEFALRAKLPPAWWIPINDILVAFGQSLCHPTSPWCSRCPVETDCEKTGVTRSR